MPRPKKPTALKILEGNPGKRPLPENEPKPAPILPEPPEWFDEVALSFWQEHAPKLHKLGLFTEIDGPAFEAVCERYSVYVKCAKVLKEKGLLTKTPQGYEQQRPEVSIAKNALSDVKAFLTEFGMTPAARSKIEIKLDKDDDSMEGLLSGVK